MVRLRPLTPDGRALRFTGSRAAAKTHFLEAAELIRAKKIEPLKLYTHFVSLEALPEVFAEAAQGRLQAQAFVKILIDMSLAGKVIRA